MLLSEPFPDSFNKIASQQLTHDRYYIYKDSCEFSVVHACMQQWTHVYRIIFFYGRQLPNLCNLRFSLVGSCTVISSFVLGDICYSGQLPLGPQRRAYNDTKTSRHRTWRRSAFLVFLCGREVSSPR